VLTGGTPILFNQPQFNAVGSVVVASLAVMQVSPEVLNGRFKLGAIFANETSSPWIVSSNTAFHRSRADGFRSSSPNR